MNELNFTIKEAVNEPIKEYKPGSPEKASLKSKLEELKSQTFDIPIIINGQEIRTGDTGNCLMPHNHQHILATYHKAGAHDKFAAIEVKLNGVTANINPSRALYSVLFFIPSGEYLGCCL